MSDDIDFFVLECEDGRRWGYINRKIAERRMEQLSSEGLQYKLHRIYRCVEQTEGQPYRFQKSEQQKRKKPAPCPTGLYIIKSRNEEEVVKDWCNVKTRITYLRSNSLPYSVWKWNEMKQAFMPLKKYNFRVRAS